MILSDSLIVSDGDIPLSGAGDFLLVEKVTKAPPRGKPLGYPLFEKR